MTPNGTKVNGNQVDLAEQYILNSSFDKVTGLQMVELVGVDASGNITRVGVQGDGTLGVAQAERYDYSGSPIYVGSAPMGSTTSSPVWTINAYNLPNGTGLVALKAIWDNRGVTSYV